MVKEQSPFADDGKAGNRRETLTSRAKRIIGRALETPNKSGNVGSPEAEEDAGKGIGKKTTTKRREQVLQAQRTHRQRTQGYIRELEKEVLRIRERESALEKKQKELNQKLQALEQHILQSNIPFPIGYAISETTSNILTTTASQHSSSMTGSLSPTSHVGSLSTSATGLSPETFTYDSFNNPSNWSIDTLPPVNVDFTMMNEMEPVKCTNYKFEWDICPNYNPPAPSLLPQRQQNLSPNGNGMNTGPNQNGLSIGQDKQAALDFVLALEKVCFPHLKEQYLVDPTLGNGIPDDNWGPNHVYMATTNLLNHHLTNSSDPTAQAFTVPAPDVDALLQTSMQVDFGSDVTPVQVWANIERMRKKGWLVTPDVLELFIEELRKYARCNGFAAVLEKDTVKQLFGVFFKGEEYQG